MCDALVAIARLVPRLKDEADVIGLRALAPEPLARYVADREHPSWRRLPCIHALQGRVPEAGVASLIERLQDPEDDATVRHALLRLLQDRVELLPWLREQPADGGGFSEACLYARANLGDLTAAPAIVTLANGRLAGDRRQGETALELLVSRRGAAAVHQQLGDERPADRVVRVRLAARSGEDVTRAFGDVDVEVARAACEVSISAADTDDEMLLDYVVTGPTMTARLWAAYTLHRRGREICDLWRALDCPRIEIAGLDDELRLAFLREYPCEARTDPHWLVEAAAVELPSPPDTQGQLSRVVAVLEAAGLSPAAVEIGALRLNSGATYHVIKIVGGGIEVSTLGRFVRGRGGTTHPAARRALEAAGFRWIDPVLGAVRVVGLHVFLLGTAGPRDVQTLLFNRQD